MRKDAERRQRMGSKVTWSMDPCVGERGKYMLWLRGSKETALIGVGVTKTQANMIKRTIERLLPSDITGSDEVGRANRAALQSIAEDLHEDWNNTGSCRVCDSDTLRPSDEGWERGLCTVCHITTD